MEFMRKVNPLFGVNRIGTKGHEGAKYSGRIPSPDALIRGEGRRSAFESFDTLNVNTMFVWAKMPEPAAFWSNMYTVWREYKKAAGWTRINRELFFSLDALSAELLDDLETARESLEGYAEVVLRRGSVVYDFSEYVTNGLESEWE